MKIAIINRSFWPIYPVIGEALLRLAEQATAEGHQVSVILQDHVGVKEKLKEEKRGDGVSFYPVKALTSSSSGLLTRVADAVFFAIWVFFSLVKTRPKKVYVSTDPPVTVPFIVMVYCWLFRASYIYHLQDIHPEATNIIVPLPRFLFKCLQKLDSVTMARAECLITLTERMASVIKRRTDKADNIVLLDNPSVSFDGASTDELERKLGFAFCGNAGRLQLIPLMLDAIADYYERGGQCEFVFAGGGVFSPQLGEFDSRYPLFSYRGVVSPAEAAMINKSYSWALLPIDDEVTNFAFPSKSSSYVLSGASIFSVCGGTTSVADWVKKYGVGVVVAPLQEDIVNAFFEIEEGSIKPPVDQKARELLASRLGFDRFVNALCTEITKSQART